MLKCVYKNVDHVYEKCIQKNIMCLQKLIMYWKNVNQDFLKFKEVLENVNQEFWMC